MEERTTITIKNKYWKKLAKLKLDLDVKTFDEVIEYLLIKVKGGKRNNVKSQKN